MNKEFDLSSLHFLSDTNLNNKMSAEDLLAIDKTRGAVNAANDIIEVYDAENGGVTVAYTYAKFLETFEKFGLGGFVTA